MHKTSASSPKQIGKTASTVLPKGNAAVPLPKHGDPDAGVSPTRVSPRTARRAVPRIGRRKPEKRTRWNAPVAGAQGDKPAKSTGAKVGIRVPDFKRDKSGYVLEAQAGVLNKRVQKKGFLDRLKPHYDDLVTLSTALRQYRNSAHRTEEVLVAEWMKHTRPDLPDDSGNPFGKHNGDPFNEPDSYIPRPRQYPVGPQSIHKLLQGIEGEEDVLGSALRAQQRALARTGPFFPGDKARLRTIGQHLQTQLNALAEAKRQMQDTLSGKGMSEAEAKLYVQAGIPITPQNRELAFMDDDFVRNPKQAQAKGAMHHVEFVQCHVVDPSTGQVDLVPKVFKNEPPRVHLPEAASVTGIQNSEAKLSVRAVAAYQVSDLLQSPLIPRTELAYLDGELGVAMDVVPGSPLQMQGRAELPLGDQEEQLAQWAEDYPDDLNRFAQARGFDGAKLVGRTIVFTREAEGVAYDEFGQAISKDGYAVMVKSAAPIQVSPDRLLGVSQMSQLAAAGIFNELLNASDAHMGNCAFTPGGVLQYFDNDISFGPTSPDLDNGAGLIAVHLTHLPEVIPRTTYAAITDLSPDSLVARLEGRLNPPEINATLARLARLKEHCDACRLRGDVLDDADPRWMSPDVLHKLGLDGILAARGDLQALQALPDALSRRNVPARYLLQTCVTEARSEAAQRGEYALDPLDAVTFDPVALKRDLLQVSSPAAVR